MPYRHVLVVCDGSSEADTAVLAASHLALRELGCDATMLAPRPRRRLTRTLRRDPAKAVRRRTDCTVPQPR